MPIRRIAKEEGTRPGSYFYHVNDGFHYHKNLVRDGTWYFKCIYYEQGCFGRASYKPNTGFQHSEENLHRHEPDMFYSEEMRLRRDIILRCSSLEYLSFRQIVDDECGRYCDEVSHRITLNRMRNVMRKVRLQNYPQPPPRSLFELTRLLNDDRFRVMSLSEDGQDNIYAGSVTAVDNSHHVIFASQRQLRFLQRSRVLHSDGTFKVFPCGLNTGRSAQLFVILTTWRSRILPLVWVLMERRTELAYDAVLGFISHCIGGPIPAGRIVTDFEEAERNAWGTVCHADCNRQGCLVHACRRFVLYASIEMGLTWWVRNSFEVRRLLRLTCAIPLLPAHLMFRGLTIIMRECREEGRQIYLMLRPYFRYIYNEWLSTREKRRALCVFRSNVRTNNACESHNESLKKTLGVHGNIYNFIGKLVRLEAVFKRDVQGLQDGRNVGRGSKLSAVNNDRRLRNLERDLIHPQGRLNDAILNFLRRASRTLQNLFDNAVDFE